MPTLHLTRLLPWFQVAAVAALVTWWFLNRGAAVGHLSLAAAHLVASWIVASYFGARTLRVWAILLILLIPVELAALGQSQWDQTKRRGIDDLAAELTEQVRREQPPPLSTTAADVAEINELARRLLGPGDTPPADDSGNPASSGDPCPSDGGSAGGSELADVPGADPPVGVSDREQELIELRAGLLAIREGLSPPDPTLSATDDVRDELSRVIERLPRPGGADPAEVAAVLADVEQLTVTAAEVVCRDEALQERIDGQVAEMAAVAATGRGPSDQPPEEAERRLLRLARAALNELAAATTDEARRAELVAQADALEVRLQAVSGPPSLDSVIDLGATRLFDDLYRTTFRRPAPLDDPDLGWLPWLIVAMIAIAGYRNLEIINGRREAGPVVVEVDEASKRSDDVGPQFKELLGMADLYEPAALPLGTTSRQVVDILQNDSGAPSLAIQAVITVLQATAFPARGVVATVRYDDPGMVAVRVRDRRSNRTRYAMVFHGREALREAAAFVASTALRNSRVTPRWAQWSALADGRDLAAYQQVVGEGRTLTEGRRLIEQAIARGPTSSLALARKAELLSTKGDGTKPQLLEALVYDLRALKGGKRFVVARWRAMANLSMIAGKPDVLWSDDPAVLEQLRQVARVIDPTFHRFVQNVDEHRSRCDVSRALREAAARERSRLALLLSTFGVVALAITVQSERTFWTRMLLDGRRRDRQRAALRIAKSLIALRSRQTHGPDCGCAEARPVNLVHLIDQVRRAVRRAPDDAVVSYNAACFLAVASLVTANARIPPPSPLRRAWWWLIGTSADRPTAEALQTEAMELLTAGRYAENGPEITKEWLKIDPDLQPLRKGRSDRFGRFVSSVHRDEDVARRS